MIGCCGGCQQEAKKCNREPLNFRFFLKFFDEYFTSSSNEYVLFNYLKTCIYLQLLHEILIQNITKLHHCLVLESLEFLESLR